MDVDVDCGQKSSITHAKSQSWLQSLFVIAMTGQEKTKKWQPQDYTQLIMIDSDGPFMFAMVPIKNYYESQLLLLTTNSILYLLLVPS